MADYRKIEAAFQERDARIKRLTEDLQRVNNDMSIIRDEMNQLLKKKVIRIDLCFERKESNMLF